MGFSGITKLRGKPLNFQPQRSKLTNTFENFKAVSNFLPTRLPDPVRTGTGGRSGGRFSFSRANTFIPQNCGASLHCGTFALTEFRLSRNFWGFVFNYNYKLRIQKYLFYFFRLHFGLNQNEAKVQGLQKIATCFLPWLPCLPAGRSSATPQAWSH